MWYRRWQSADETQDHMDAVLMLMSNTQIYRKKKSNVTGPLVWEAFSSGVVGQMYPAHLARQTMASATLQMLTNMYLLGLLPRQDPNIDACAWFSGNMTLLSSSPKKVRWLYACCCSQSLSSSRAFSWHMQLGAMTIISCHQLGKGTKNASCPGSTAS
jgi:hypothetical protein